jgi:hypothetical protein
MVFKTKTVLNPLAAEGTDIKTFQGTISMLDYMGKRPMTLHLMVHLKKCGLNTILFHQLSPQPYGDPVWKGLQALWTTFRYIQ